MDTAPRIRRFGVLDRLTHVLLILTFMVLTVTGTGRMYFATDWGQAILDLFGGYDSATLIHIWAGWLMTGGFLFHIAVVLFRLDWRHLGRSLFGPDSLVPTWRDFKEFGQRIAWFFGLAKLPRFERWNYWEKFDYWAVFWGVPLLFISGLMLIYPVETSRLLPGWVLNVALLFHRAEAVLAVTYIIIVHLLIGHFRRSTFPLNEVMFSGSVSVEEAGEEKSDWINRLKRENRLEQLSARAPATLYRVLYFIFGYAVIALGLYLLIAGGYYSQFINIH
ncbi:MAG: cytochrome C [Gammaproteobacteria bacterium]|nr:cytochrome C [Gammaproteobacteria bacterium]